MSIGRAVGTGRLGEAEVWRKIGDLQGRAGGRQRGSRGAAGNYCGQSAGHNTVHWPLKCAAVPSTLWRSKTEGYALPRRAE